MIRIVGNKSSLHKIIDSVLLMTEFEKNAFVHSGMNCIFPLLLSRLVIYVNE
jgi:hypothetical protein